MCFIRQDRNKNIEKVFFNGKKGQTVMVTLLSDGIFQSTKGTGYSIYYDDLQNAVAEELGNSGRPNRTREVSLNDSNKRIEWISDNVEFT